MENTLFLSYLTLKRFSFNMQKDFHFTRTATVFDKILCSNQWIGILFSEQIFEIPVNRLTAFDSDLSNRFLQIFCK